MAMLRAARYNVQPSAGVCARECKPAHTGLLAVQRSTATVELAACLLLASLPDACLALAPDDHTHL